ncbi:MAG: hypothetical protein IKP86_03645 [Anaerolineaceae bacterium]|nr:hypothetical protein [Anaerolineaceae bacterium]
MKKTMLIISLIILMVITGISSADTKAPVPAQRAVTAGNFCRTYDEDTNTVTINYSLTNTTSGEIPLQLATTLDVQGQPRYLLITYTACSAKGADCKDRIKEDYEISLASNEMITLTGTVNLDIAPIVSNFSVYTSLVYKLDGETVALSLGSTQNSCGAEPVPPTPTTGELTPVSFCRTYDSASQNVSFQYTLKNETKFPIIIQPAKTLRVTDEVENPKTSYKSCSYSDGGACTIDAETFTLAAGKTVTFAGEAPLTKAPAADFSVYTSLIYSINRQEKILSVGTTTSECPAEPVVPIPTDSSITSDGFCRIYKPKAGKVFFTYSLTNSTDSDIPVELASTLDVQGQDTYLPISYGNCVRSDGYSCFYRIENGYDFTLQAKETAIFSGEVTLLKVPAAGNFSVYTSLIYKVNGINKVLSLGSTQAECSVGKDITNLMPEQEFEEDFSISLSSEKDALTFMIQMENSNDSSTVIRPDTIYFHNAEIDEYDGSLRLEDEDGFSADKDLISFAKGDVLTIPAHQTLTFLVTLPFTLPDDASEYQDNSFALGWLFNINNKEYIYNGIVNYTANILESKTVNTEGNVYLQLIPLGFTSLQGSSYSIPGFGSWAK